MRSVFKLVALVSLLLTPAVWAQVVAPISGQAINQFGQPLPFASVRICSVTSTGSQCVPTSPIFLDYNLTIPAPNPYGADQFGNYTVYVPAIAAPNLYEVQLSPASGITWTYVVKGPETGGGGTGCTLGTVPNQAVVVNHGGACYGDTLFTYSGGSGSTGGTIDINNNTSVLLETGANIEVNSATDSSHNFWLQTGDHLFEHSNGAVSLGGIDLQISDSASTSSVGPVPYFLNLTEARAGKNAIGMNIELFVANSIAAGKMTGIEVDGPSLGASNSATSVWGFIASMAADSLPTVEEFGYLAETPAGGTINSNYCDFAGRVHFIGTIRETLGCGPTGANTFNGPTTFQDITINGTCTGSGCGSGGGGTIAHTLNVLKGDNSGNAIASTILDTGTSITLGTPGSPAAIFISGSGNNGTINFGANFGAPAIILYDGGGGGRLGWGLLPGEMQFFMPGGNHFSWNGGGDLQTSGTNEFMRLTPTSFLTLTSGEGYCWAASATSSVTPDTCLWRDSAGVMDLGNATPGNKSGSLNLTNLTVTGTCTGCGGSSVWSAIGAPTGNLALTMLAHTSTFTYNATTGSSDMFALTDTASNTGTGILLHPHTASGSTEIPWQADANGVGWKVDVDGSLRGVGGTNAGTLALGAGSAPGSAPTSTIQLYAPASVTAYSAVLPGAQPVAGSNFLSCTAANPAICSYASPLISVGTKFITSGCSVSSTTGGSTAGTLTLGANSCTVVITMNGATGLTAPNGWSCDAHDRTAPTVLIGGESSSTTTTASIVIPAGAGATDVISFSCTGY